MTWMFTYGELIGEPLIKEFSPEPATLDGFHRSFNHQSSLVWGTEQHPCPTLGLSPGGRCRGLVFKVPWLERRRVLKYLRPSENEHQFEPARLNVTTDSGTRRKALVYVSRPEFASSVLDHDTELEPLFVDAHGITGRGVEYVRALVHGMSLWGIEDPEVAKVWRRLENWRPR